MRRAIGLICCAILLPFGCSRDEGSPVVEQPAAETDYGATDAPTDTEGPTAQATECKDLRSQASPMIEMQDFRFVPSCVVLTTSQGFGNRNTGSVPHNFSIEGVPGVDVDTQPGQENNYEPPGIDAAIYSFFCKFHRDSQGMKGELRVVGG